MRFSEEARRGRDRWLALTLYRKFEHGIVLILTGLIAIVIIAAVWSLALESMQQRRALSSTGHNRSLAMKLRVRKFPSRAP